MVAGTGVHHTCLHTHRGMQTDRHTHIYTQIHRHTCRHTHTHTQHTHMHVHTHTTCKHTQTCRHTHTRRHTHTDMLTDRHTHIQTHTDTYTHVHIHTHVQTHTHTRTHACMHTHTQLTCSKCADSDPSLRSLPSDSGSGHEHVIPIAWPEKHQVKGVLSSSVQLFHGVQLLMNELSVLLGEVGVGVVGLDVEPQDPPRGRVFVVGPVEEEIGGADVGGVELHG